MPPDRVLARFRGAMARAHLRQDVESLPEFVRLASSFWPPPALVARKPRAGRSPHVGTVAFSMCVRK
eukprot:9268975-Alexandrium_andersonii.AAC.1